MPSRADQIFDAFAAFHTANPEVWRHFERFTLETVSAGWSHYSSNAIFERIRWYIDIEVGPGDEVKLNNNFRAYYARLFHIAHPEHDGFFRNRHMTSIDRSAYEDDLQVFNSGKPVGEDELLAKLDMLLRYPIGDPDNLSPFLRHTR